MKKITQFLIGLFAFTLVSFAAHAAESPDQELSAALDKLQKAGIISAEDHAYWAENAIPKKMADMAKVRELLAAVAKYYGGPSNTNEEIVDTLLKNKVIANKKWVNTLESAKKQAGGTLNPIIKKIAKNLP